MFQRTTPPQSHAIPILIVLIAGFGLIGCMPQSANFVTPISSIKSPTTSTENDRLSNADAESLVRDYIFRESPDMNPEANFPLEEITTDEIWQKLHVQLFRLTNDGPVGPETYVIANGEVDVIGYSVGGYGVTSMFVTDLDSDMNPELTYTHSSGSGIHRAFVSVYFPNHIYPRNIDANLQYLFGDLILERVNDQNIFIVSSYYDWEKNVFVTDITIGQVFLESHDSQLLLSVDLNPNLPPDIIDRLYTH